MKVLLDTHLLIWAFENNPLLPKKARAIILDNENEIYYSCVSTWEIAIKHSLHPEELNLNETMFVDLCKASGFIELPLSSKHVQSLSSLKCVAETKHKDPFDRMLMAQSISEKMTFISKDSKLEIYELPNMIIVN